jgi:phage shock protein PspC (stress-responsive transcriptional regulator)
VARGSDRIIAGVADGLSEALGVPPVWTRLAFVVLAFFGGLGVAVYVAAWLLLPATPNAPTPRGLRRVAGIAVVPLWLLALAQPSGDGSWPVLKGPFFLALFLVGVALALWKPGSTQPRQATRTASVPTAASPAAETVAAPERPPASPLGRLALGVSLLVAAVGSAITDGSSDGVKVSFALAALICGAGLVIGAWFGRARWLIIPALVFATISVAGAATDGLGVHQSWSGPYTAWYPDDPQSTSPPALIDKGAGDTYLQLVRIKSPVDGVIRVGHGEVRIAVDEKVHFELHARVGIGEIDLPNVTRRGYREEATYSAGPADGPLVRYDVAVGYGSIVVDRYTVRPSGPVEPADVLPPGAIGGDGRGAFVYPDGTTQLADGTIILSDGTAIGPDGTRVYGSGARMLPDGVVILPDGTTIQPDGSVHLATGGIVLVPRPPGSASPTTAVAPTTVTVPPATATTVAPATATTVSPAPTTGGKP